MSKIINIGITNTEKYQLAAQKLAENLSLKGYEVNIHKLSVLDQNDIETLSEAIANNTISIGILPLKSVPLEKTSNLIIAGLAERKFAGDCIIMHKDVMDSSAPLRIKNGSKVLVPSELHQHQLQTLNADIQLHVDKFKITDALNQIQNRTIDGILIGQSEAESMAESLKDIEIIRLNPKELIPESGSGVFAYLVHPEDIEVRKLCQTIHHKETADVTNVERKIKQLSGDVPTHAYCYKDTAGYFHCIAARHAGQYQTTRYSQSTSVGLAEKVVQSFHL